MTPTPPHHPRQRTVRRACGPQLRQLGTAHARQEQRLAVELAPNGAAGAVRLAGDPPAGAGGSACGVRSTSLRWPRPVVVPFAIRRTRCAGTSPVGRHRRRRSRLDRCRGWVAGVVCQSRVQASGGLAGRGGLGHGARSRCAGAVGGLQSGRHLTTREVAGGEAVGRVVEPGPVEAGLHAAAVGGEPHRVYVDPAAPAAPTSTRTGSQSVSTA